MVMVESVKQWSGMLVPVAKRVLPVPVWRCLQRQRLRLWSWRGLSESQAMARQWEIYARRWSTDNIPAQVLPGARVRYLGDEWTAEEHASLGGQAYGLSPDVVADFDGYIEENLLGPYLPPAPEEGLEIGPGGGRLTALLLPRTGTLHASDPSKTMLRHLEQRFAGVPNLYLYHTDGATLPPLRPASLDYVLAFDVFILFEPRLIYWHLLQIKPLLKPGGTAIFNYANVLTRIGWHRFESELEENLGRRIDPGAFGVMCPELLVGFLEALGLETISADTGAIPRDAVAVFRKPVEDG